MEELDGTNRSDRSNWNCKHRFYGTYRNHGSDRTYRIIWLYRTYRVTRVCRKHRCYRAYGGNWIYWAHWIARVCC